MAQADSNNSLYFIVGGIVVALVVAFLYFNNGGSINHDASPTSSISVDTNPDSNVDKTDIKINENGASITHSESE